MIAIGVLIELSPWLVVVGGLSLFGLIFAINSAVHSYLILAYSNDDLVALDVGFYYMANATGRLFGTLLSGIIFQLGGLAGCLLVSTLLILIASFFTLRLPRNRPASE